MADMLVKLYTLPSVEEAIKKLKANGITVRRALVPEKHFVTNWVGKHFSQYWQSECEVAFSRQPVSCYLALEQGKIIGFACYEVTCKNFFGPTGVLESHRGKGLGKVLLVKALEAMKELGYGYAIIGGVGPADFYTRAVGAMLIENSEPGVYEGLIRDK
ncbi:GNAT family N-acetyltransferase [Rapidithrix thailandica]|uniref:GNAT family N-acetyltransferase n=1 Tax=Rapidithrix thailandica TaxID=413964 RepID=A0AAW9SBZ3_9BACT